MKWQLMCLFCLVSCRGEPLKLESGLLDDTGLSETGETAETGATGDTGEPLVDADGDGFAETEDCDDSRSDVYPGATEICDDVDQDCDGEIDEEAQGASTWYVDTDGDGHGDLLLPVNACDQPSGYVSDSSDCNDEDSAVYPGADEYCNGVDDDCDGDVDEDDALDTRTWYADADGDGFGDEDGAITTCATPSGYVFDSSDCNDEDSAVYPGADEYCNGVDDDCDGQIDEDEAVDAGTWYVDADGDGYGSSNVSTVACAQPSGFADNLLDCDDGDAASNPAATEVCDEADNDCDGSVDEEVESTWYLDYDGDGYGDDAFTAEACSAPTANYVAQGGDCEDTSTDYFPGATPGCDGEDYDCDGDVDSDADGDGYADATCGGSDCDDTDASILPEQGGGCAVGESCLDVLNSLRSNGDGTYELDPDGYAAGEDPFEASCDMTTDGGGWTLVATNGWSGSWWTSTTISDDSTVSVGSTGDFKSEAFSSVLFTDLLFENGTMFAIYEAVGDGSQGYYDFQAGVTSLNCGETEGFSWEMTSGDLTSSLLCDTDLYLHVKDWDGASCEAYSYSTNHGYGPAWSANYNHGCPLDDPEGASFIIAWSHNPWGDTDPLSMWVR